MRVQLHRHFIKSFSKLTIKIQYKAKEKIHLFSINPLNPALRNHALSGKYAGSRSIDITGDLRAIYKIISNDEVLFVDIGTHSQLYG